MSSNLPMALVPYSQQIQSCEAGSGLSGGLRLAVILSVLLVFVLALAAALVPIGGAVIGGGQVGVQSRVKQISHPAGGVVAAILVQNGQHVRKGQILIRFDDKVSGTDARLSALSVDQLLAQRARLEAERLGASTLVFPPELASRTDAAARKAMDDEARLFAIRRREQSGIAAQLADRKRQYQLQIAGYQAQIRSLQAQAKLIEPERQGVRSLWERGLVTVRRVNELERTAMDFDGSIGSLQASIAQTEARISEAQEQLIQLAESRRAEAGTQLAQANALLNQQQVRSVSAVDLHERTTVRAPYDGIVDKLAVTTVGGVVKSGEVMMEIVPDRDALLVEASVSPNDVDQLRPGLPVRIRFSSLNSTATPEVRGTLAFVAAERSTDPATRMSFFPVKVAIDPNSLRRATSVRLLPGMPAEIYVETGSRTMLSYLTKPLRDQWERAFRDN
jgi:HlyD family type I secretion membrane fusion protein